jgi:threonine dehydrogenase-like Zn-dependent dehydrogenase
VWTDARHDGGAWTHIPAVSLALAKRAGANAVVVAGHVLGRLDLAQIEAALICGEASVALHSNAHLAARESTRKPKVQ